MMKWKMKTVKELFVKTKKEKYFFMITHLTARPFQWAGRYDSGAIKCVPILHGHYENEWMHEHKKKLLCKNVFEFKIGFLNIKDLHRFL